MPSIKDGPISHLFWPLHLQALEPLCFSWLSNDMSAALQHAPSGECVSWASRSQ